MNFRHAMLVFFLTLSAGIYAQEGEIPKEEIKEMGHFMRNFQLPTSIAQDQEPREKLIIKTRPITKWILSWTTKTKN